MKIAFIVLGVLLLPVALIAIALALPVKLKALYKNGTLDLRLTYLFYTYSEYTTGQEKPDLSEILRRLKARKKRKKRRKESRRKDGKLWVSISEQTDSEETPTKI